MGGKGWLVGGTVPYFLELLGWGASMANCPRGVVSSGGGPAVVTVRLVADRTMQHGSATGGVGLQWAVAGGGGEKDVLAGRADGAVVGGGWAENGRRKKKLR